MVTYSRLKQNQLVPCRVEKTANLQVLVLRNRNHEPESQKNDSKNQEYRNLIYAVRCKKCNVLYVGHTGERLKDRMSKHRYDCRKRPDNTELSFHFHPNHDPEKDMEIFILQTGLKTVEEREFYEDRWICRLQTLQPTGVNKDIHPYAQAMYKCFKDLT